VWRDAGKEHGKPSLAVVQLLEEADKMAKEIAARRVR
jgi:hypothetical protein